MRDSIDTAGHQFQRLVNFENKKAAVFYVAPRFTRWSIYDRAYLDNQVLEKSLTIRASEIMRGIQAQGGSEDLHRIVYDQTCCYLCSKPIKLRETVLGEMAHEIGERARILDSPLEYQIERLFHHFQTETGLKIIAAPLWERLFKRSERHVEAMAAIIGLVAWIQGAQLIFVTDAALDERRPSKDHTNP